MFIALLVLFSLGAGQLPATATPPPDPKLIRVHVQTDDTGDPIDLEARRESVRQLVAAIAARKKSGMVTVPDGADNMDVFVKVQERGVTIPKVVIGLGGGMGPQAGRPGPAATPVKTVQLRTRIALARGGDPVTITSKNRAMDSEAGWKSTAEDIAKQIEKWIADNKTAILEARQR